MDKEEKSKRLDKEDEKRAEENRESFKEADDTESIGIAYFLAFFAGAIVSLLVSCSNLNDKI